jgi:hypothetical protein
MFPKLWQKKKDEGGHAQNNVCAIWKWVWVCGLGAAFSQFRFLGGIKNTGGVGGHKHAPSTHHPLTTPPLAHIIKKPSSSEAHQKSSHAKT